MYDCDALDCGQLVPKFSISQIHQRVDTSQNYLIVIALTFMLNVNIVQKESAVCNVSEVHLGNASSSCVKFPSGANADTNQFWFCVQHCVRSKKPKSFQFLVLVKKRPVFQAVFGNCSCYMFRGLRLHFDMFHLHLHSHNCAQSCSACKVTKKLDSSSVFDPAIKMYLYHS